LIIDYSVVVRTLNESRLLEDLLTSIKNQNLGKSTLEIILVDSGSTDGTLSIAEKYGCNIMSINPKDFSFGRSLNLGCAKARGKILVFISGHCIPTSTNWLRELVSPLESNQSKLSYGRQVPHPSTKFSEARIFDHYFKEVDSIQDENPFCNNANAATTYEIWQKIKFDERLTGLEDLAFAKQVIELGHKIAYRSKATVIHSHLESWLQVLKRFKRESQAMRLIFPDKRMTFLKSLSNFFYFVYTDYLHLSKNSMLSHRLIIDVFSYRSAQFTGSYLGSHKWM
jgi:rhamnosyltransferase